MEVDDGGGHAGIDQAQYQVNSPGPGRNHHEDAGKAGGNMKNPKRRLNEVPDARGCSMGAASRQRLPSICHQGGRGATGMALDRASASMRFV